MTQLLEKAFEQAARLSEEEQDAIAARILGEMEDERAWDRAFAATTDEQWDRLAALARDGIEADDSKPLDDLIDRRRG